MQQLFLRLWQRLCNVCNMALGQNIAKARALRGMTVADLAARTGVDYQALSALEKRDSKSSTFVGVIAEALGLSADDLLAGKIALNAPAPPAPLPPPTTARKTAAHAPGPDNPFVNADAAMLDEINELAYRLPVTRKAKLLEIARRELADFLADQARDGEKNVK